MQAVIGRLRVVDVYATGIGKSSTWTPYDELHVLLEGTKGYGRIVVSYNSLNFDIFMLIEGSRGQLLVNPVGKVLARLDRSWRFRDNVFSVVPYFKAYLKTLTRVYDRDSFAHNVKIFIESVRRGHIDYDDILNQVQVYEEILKRLSS